MSNNTIRVFEAFAGYGSQSIALQRLSADRPCFQYEVVGISEIDKNAISAYRAIHGESTPNFGDIIHIDWSQVPCFDLLTYSFPCQDISSAGRQRGFSQGSGTRSSLLWACADAIEAKHPKYLLMENVKALTQKKFAKDFYKWREWLSDQGYTSYFQILNAKEYGIPQNRERVFMVSVLGEHQRFFFPKTIPLEHRLKDILEDHVDESYYLKPQQVESIINHCKRNIAEGCGFKVNSQTLEVGGNIANTITTVQKDSIVLEPLFLGYTRDHNGKVVSHNLKDVSNTIVASNHGRNGTTAQYLVEPMIYSNPHGYNIGGCKILAPAVTSSAYTDNNFLIKDFRIRKLTPRECFRLMDVSDSDIDKIQSAGISQTQQFKLAGNSIVVSCLYHVFRKMFIDLSNEQPGYVQLSLF
jgi:DNA (cytosine-5)-methyltransferase 1|nr:MAG TPA: Cytosine specific methyltransferase [Caudoviricetes sp.]